MGERMEVIESYTVPFVISSGDVMYRIVTKALYCIFESKS